MPAADATAPPHGAALHDAKIALRRETLSRRDALPIEHRSAASKLISDGLARLPSFLRAHTVLLTLAFRSEWDTLPLVRAALAAGQTVAVPRVDSDTRMLSLHALTDPATEIVPGYRGIPEPRPDARTIDADLIDWVLVPGVAFDLDGRRLGYGGGYYDRLLPRLRPGVARVAGAFDIQIVAQVPSAPHDITVDAIVTETQTLTIGRH